jgi:phage terminase large subunit-like protein
MRVRLPSWELGECPIPRGYRFSKAHADRAEQFIERYLRHTKGQWAGTPFLLAPWQRRDIREIFGRLHDDGRRAVSQVYIEIPRKNGKSELAAAVALKLLFADSEPQAEVYGAAADFQQAAIVWSIAAEMVRMSPELWRRTGYGRWVLESGKRIAVPETGSVYRALTATVAGKHGYNASGVIFDELHCQRDTRLWDVLTVGAGAARRQPLVYAITTAGVPGESALAEMLHREAIDVLEGRVPCPVDFYPVVYAAPESADWADEDVWRAVNPAAGEDHELRPGGPFLRMSALRAEFEAARRRPVQEAAFRRLHLNQWLSGEQRWIDPADWAACSCAPDLNHLRRLTWYGGLDLSSRQDLTALVLAATDEAGLVWILPWFWLPGAALDAASNVVEAHRYRHWSKQGFLQICGGVGIDFESIRNRVLELRESMRVAAVAYDPMFAEQLASELRAAGIRMVEFRQTYRQYTEACDAFERAVRARDIRHPGNPVLDWCIANVRVRQRSDGAIRPVKPDRRTSAARIDGAVAAIMALGLALREPQPPSVYETATARI